MVDVQPSDPLIPHLHFRFLVLGDYIHVTGMAGCSNPLYSKDRTQERVGESGGDGC
jgi:hypothetical protein